ncbi:MAG: hypothetical protein ACD_75C02036G0002, partial [uncultured bacterium]
MPDALAIDNPSAAGVKIEVPQGMDIGCFIAAHFALLKTFGRKNLPRCLRPPLLGPPPRLHPP